MTLTTCPIPHAKAPELFTPVAEAFGIRSLSDAWDCAHSVTGRRHTGGYERWDCFPPKVDHAETWNLAGTARRLLTYHPYWPPKAEAFDARWGTRTVVLPPSYSWWNPGPTANGGHTWLVLVADRRTERFPAWALAEAVTP